MTGIAAAEPPVEGNRILRAPLMGAWLAVLLVLSLFGGWLSAQDTWQIPLMVAAAGAILALISPVAALCFLVLTFPAEILTAGVGHTYARVAGIGVGAILLPQVVAQWVEANRGRPRLPLPALLLWSFLLFALLSGVFAQDRGAWMQGMWMLLSRAALFGVVSYYAVGRRSAIALLAAVTVAVGIAAALGVAEWCWGYRVVEARTFSAEATIGAVRASGIFESPISLSFALIVGIGSASFFLVWGRGWPRFAGLAAALIMLVALALSMTRSAVAAVLALFAILFITPAVLPRWARIAIIALLVMVALASPGSVKRRFASAQFLSSESSIHNRPLMLIAGMNMALANPLGVGLRNFERHYDDYKALRDTESGRAGHNMYVELSATAGLAGGICFIAWIAASLAALNRTRRSGLARGDLGQCLLAASLLAVLCAMLVQGIFHTNPYQDKFFWLFMGLAQATIGREGRSASRAAQPASPTRATA